eukprot:3166061-Prymnesium_polylepis.2
MVWRRGGSVVSRAGTCINGRMGGRKGVEVDTTAVIDISTVPSVVHRKHMKGPGRVQTTGNPQAVSFSFAD